MNTVSYDKSYKQYDNDEFRETIVEARKRGNLTAFDGKTGKRIDVDAAIERDFK